MNEWDLLARKLNADRQAKILQGAQNTAANTSGGGGFFDGIGSVLSGIGNSIGNLGKSIGSTFGGTLTNNAVTVGLDALFGGKSFEQASKDAEKRQDDWVKSIYGTNDTKDAYAKNLGSSIDAASTLASFIPGVGGVGKVAMGVGQGAASGFGNELAQNGANASLETALKNAAIGAAGGGVGSAVGGKLAGIAAKNPATGIIGKAIQSNIGRGAITGAASGAVGSGLATALNGGDLGQTLSSALKGTGQGALAGATTAAIYGTAGKALGKIKDKIENPKVKNDVSNVLADQPQEDIPDATKRRQTALGWDDEPIDASRRNALQKAGKILESTGKKTENSDLYGKLNNNTALRVDKNDTINVLKKKYGYTDIDYDKAGNLSEATNAWIKNEAKTSGASGYDTGLVDRISLDNYNDGELLPLMSDKNAKVYRNKAQQLLSTAKVDGGGVDEYSAAGLYDVSEKAGKLANSYYEKSHNKMDGTVLNQDTAALAEAYRNLKIEARNAADNMLGGEIDNITRNNLTKMLKSAGAPDAAVKTLSKAKTLSELKTLTSPLEEARAIAGQVNQTELKRGATTNDSNSFVNEAAKAAGVKQLVSTAAKPVGQIVGKTEQALGKAIGKIGDAVAGEGTGIGSKAIAAPIKAAKAANSGLNMDIAGQTLGDIATSRIARQTALGLAEDEKRAREYADAQEALTNAQTDYTNAINAYNTAASQYKTPVQQAGAQTLSRIENAMQLALNAGDLASYSKLADLYKQAYGIYGTQTESANPLSRLSSTQVENVNKLDTASNAIDELEALFNKAGGGQGLVGGNAANFLASLGLNSDVATYNSISRGLINQIGAAIGKTDSLNTEGEVNRALELIPKFTDDAQTARNKLAQLRQMLNTNRQTVYQNYGLTQ